MNKILTLNIGPSLDEKIKELQKQLKEGDEVVSMVTAGEKLIITIREAKKKNKNLLLEEHRKKNVLE